MGERYLLHSDLRSNSSNLNQGYTRVRGKPTEEPSELTFEVHINLWVGGIEAFTLIVCIQAVLVDQVRNGGSESLSLASEELPHECLILVNRATEDDTAVGFEQSACGISVFLPNLASDKGRINDNHMEGAKELSRQVLRRVEIVENIARVLVESRVELLIVKSKEENRK